MIRGREVESPRRFAPFCTANFLVLLFMVVAFGGSRRMGQMTPLGPSVLLVTIDTLRADHVGAYGAAGALTPTLDRLAREGVRFATAIAPAPLTLPSHASLLTGLYPPRHGARTNGLFKLDASVETLAQRFQNAGYATAAVIGSTVLSKRYGLSRGFDTYDDEIIAKTEGPGPFDGRRADDVTDRALRWLSQTKRPFFLWVHYYDVHAPYTPPPAFAERFRAAPYDGEVAYVDSSLARLLDGLRPDARAANLVGIVTADHGESLGAHGEETHGYSLYDATQHVPLIWWGTGVPAGRVVDGVASLVDVAPTVLSLARCAPLIDVDGQDLTPELRGTASLAERTVYAETLATRYDQGWSPLYALRTPRLLYVRAPTVELYDVGLDPDQARNLLYDDPGNVRAVIAQMEPQLQRILAHDASAPNTARLDHRTLERLRSLGYTMQAGTVEFNGIDPKEGLRWFGVYDQAVDLYHRGHFRSAEDALIPMVRALPSSPLAQALLTRIYDAQGAYEAALGHANEAVRLVPESAEYRTLVGDLKLALGDDKAASTAYSEARTLDEDDPGPLIGLMKLAVKAQRRSDARQLADDVVRRNPNDLLTLTAIGKVWRAAGVYDLAAEAYRKALAIDPTYAEAHARLWLVLIRQHQDEEAHRQELLAGSLAQTAEFRNRLGIAYAVRNDARLAEGVLRDLLREHPEFAPARKNLAHVLRSAGRGKEADQIESEGDSRGAYDGDDDAPVPPPSADVTGSPEKHAL